MTLVIFYCENKNLDKKKNKIFILQVYSTGQQVNKVIT